MHYDEHGSLTTTVFSDDEGNLSLDFPEELLEAINWREGDTLAIEAFAGRIILRKLEAPEEAGGS
jgi:hypothetical protein